MPGAGAASLAAWQMYMQALHSVDSELKLEASTVDEAAHVLIIYCIWVHAGRPHGLKFKEIVQEQFTAPRPTIDSDGPHVPFSLLSLHVQMFVLCSFSANS
jgi:hypothetical protein